VQWCLAEFDSRARTEGNKCPSVCRNTFPRDGGGRAWKTLLPSSRDPRQTTILR